MKNVRETNYQNRGAVKPNIGHLEGGSGIAAVIKAILILEKGFIPPNANFENLNPDIDAEFLNLKVRRRIYDVCMLCSPQLIAIQIPTELTPWPTEGLRRISVASFGYGGSNAHAILDDAFNFLQSRNLKGLTCSADPFLSASHAASTSRSNLSSQVLVWSTEDEAGVDRTIEAYTDHFQNLDLASLENTSFLPQLANTLATKRSQLQWRSFAIVDSVNALGESLKNLVSKPVRVGKGQNIGFIFTGQGAQYIGMGLELLSYPIFLQTMKQCELVFQGLGCPWSLLGEDITPQDCCHYQLTD